MEPTKLNLKTLDINLNCYAYSKVRLPLLCQAERDHARAFPSGYLSGTHRFGCCLPRRTQDSTTLRCQIGACLDESLLGEIEGEQTISAGAELGLFVDEKDR